jgi:hypothetical protein
MVASAPAASPNLGFIPILPVAHRQPRSCLQSLWTVNIRHAANK